MTCLTGHENPRLPTPPHVQPTHGSDVHHSFPRTPDARNTIRQADATHRFRNSYSFTFNARSSTSSAFGPRIVT